MKKINLRNHYSFLYPQDTFIEVTDDIAALLNQLDREEHAYYERRRVHKAFYSLDADSHLEHEIVFVVLSPQDTYNQKLERNELFSAILTLPDKQMKRICAHFFMNMSITKIARIEGVDVSAVRNSISSALRRLKKNLTQH